MALTKAEVQVLRCLQDEGTKTHIELQDHFPGIKKETLHRVVIRLDAQGWVSIDKGIYPHVFRISEDFTGTDFHKVIKI